MPSLSPSFSFNRLLFLWRQVNTCITTWLNCKYPSVVVSILFERGRGALLMMDIFHLGFSSHFAVNSLLMLTDAYNLRFSRAPFPHLRTNMNLIFCLLVDITTKIIVIRFGNQFRYTFHSFLIHNTFLLPSVTQHPWFTVFLEVNFLSITGGHVLVQSFLLALCATLQAHYENKVRLCFFSN